MKRNKKYKGAPMCAFVFYEIQKKIWFLHLPNDNNITEIDKNVNNFQQKSIKIYLLHKQINTISYAIADWKPPEKVVYLNHRKDDTRCTNEKRKPVNKGFQ